MGGFRGSSGGGSSGGVGDGFGSGSLDELVLSGPRLILRPWHHRDAARVHEVMQDAGMHEFLALPDPYTLADATAFVTEFTADARRSGAALECAMVERATGALVGACALQFATSDQSRPAGHRQVDEAEVGYWVATDSRGHGFAAEATRTLADWAFAAGLDRVTLKLDPRNVASARTALAAGFAFEGVSREVAPEQPLEAPDGSTRPGDLARFARLATDPGDPIPPRFAPLPPGGLGDGVITLRTTVAADAASMAETDDAETLRWSFDGTATPPGRLLTACADAGLHWLVDHAAMMTIVDVESGALAGAISLRISGPPGLGSIGYVVHPSFRGRGYTTRALRLLIDWAFDDAGFARLELGAKSANIASQRAALNAGFEPDGVRAGRLRAADGSFHDEAQFALLNRLSPRVR